MPILRSASGITHKPVIRPGNCFDINSDRIPRLEDNYNINSFFVSQS